MGWGGGGGGETYGNADAVTKFRYYFSYIPPENLSTSVENVAPRYTN